MNKTWQIHGALVLVGLIYGANYVIAKGVMPDYLSPNAFILIRASAATVLFWIYHAFTSTEKVKRKKDYLLFAKCSIFGVMANQLIFFNGLSLTSPVNASIIMTANPIIVLLISVWLLNEKMTWRKIIGILVGAVGVVLLVLNKKVSLDNDGFVGDVFIFMNAVFYAIYLTMVKPLMQRYEPITVVKWVFLFGSIMVIPFGIGPIMEVDFQSFPVPIWGSIVYVVVATTFLAYLLNAIALKHVSSTIVGYYIYLQPVFATVITILIGQEVFRWEKTLFALMIFFGVYLVSQQKTKAVDEG